MSNNPKISIIITVYNSEKYIETCARSLFEQSLEEIEYIFINDATPDDSINILKKTMEDYPKRRAFTKIIKLEINKGVSNARNIGVENASGEYVIHCDSDDWIDKDMYERLYNKAKDTDADIVGCNFRHEFTDTHYIFHQQYTDSVEENISRLINGKIFPSLCTSLTRRSLITDNNLSFPVGLNMGEDLFFNLQLYLHAQRIESINWPPYHYRHTKDSSCVRRTRESIDSDIAIAEMIEELMKKEKLDKKYANDINYRKFFSKLPLMFDLRNSNNYQDWLKIFPETNNSIWQYHQLDWKQRTILWLAANNKLTYARLFQKFLEWQHKIRC